MPTSLGTSHRSRSRLACKMIQVRSMTALTMLSESPNLLSVKEN
jgi:hypothetical protein